MSDMMIKTESVYTKFTHNDGSHSKYMQKLGEMYSAGKTNGYSETHHRMNCDCSLDQLRSSTVTRFWADQESAQEWKDFLISLNEQFDQGLKSTDILPVEN